MNNVKVDPTFHLLKTKNERDSKEYREYRRKWKDNPENFIVEDFPIHLDIETTTQCNLRCFMCYQSFDRPEPISLSYDVFQKCVDEGSKKGLCSLKTQYRGEPLLDSDMPQKIKYAKDSGIVEVMLNTNAMLLDRNKAKALIDAGIDKIICSVDGYTKEVYESVRIGATFEVVLNNIKNLQEIKKEMGNNYPIVRVQMVDTPKNHHQIKKYMDFWGEIADQVAVEDMLDWKAEEEDATVLENFACAQLWQRLLVLADGDMLPCCRAMRGGNEKLEVLGNVNNENISDVWKGDKLNRLRKLHKNGESHKIKMCRACGLRKCVIKKEKGD